ncbi:hypothetical protein JXJ21_17065 [candidate division KSB1 bacterium]|nr:hypothetical protein [candidate division KSB1 bacterium]
MSKLIKSAAIRISLTVVFISVICLNFVDWAKADEKTQTTTASLNAGEISSDNSNTEMTLLDDRAALVALYNSTDGDNWNHNDNWLSSNPIDTWYGVTVSGGRVTQLYLWYNNLVGTIPPEIGNLTNLTSLSLNDNQLAGTISPEIGNLTNLTRLSLYDNQLGGTIPPEIGNLTNLTCLDLDKNQLGGTIPPQIGNLTNLNELRLGNNQLVGSIPPEIGNLTNLTCLSLGDNQLAGQIPPEIGNLTNLRDLILYNNQFTDLPDLSHLSHLDDFYIQENRFTFEDIEPNIGIPSFLYSPQAKVGEVENITKTVGSSVTFSVTVGGTANQYQWFVDDYGILGATSSEYTIDPIDYNHAGTYTCRISNTIATELTLESHPKNLTVVEDAPTSITVTSPNGGETWQVGTAYDITWTSDKYNGDVQIELSTNGGSTWWDITQGSFTENDGTHSYTPVSENISNHCLFKVISTADPTVQDQSDQEFSIASSSPTPLLAVDPATLDFGATLSSLNFQITNQGGGTLTWQVAENPDKSWMTSVSPSSGTNNATVTVNVNRSGLNPGAYSGNLSVTSNGGNQNITIRMNVPTIGPFILDGDSTDWMGEPFCSSAPNNQPNYFPAEVFAIVSDNVDIKHVKAKIIDNKIYFFIRLWDGPAWPNFCQRSDGRIYNRGYYHLLVDLDNDPNTGWNTHWHECHLTTLGYYNSLGLPNTNPIGAEAYFELGLRTDYYPPHGDGHALRLEYFAEDVHEFDSHADLGNRYDIFDLEPANPDTFDLHRFDGYGYDQVAADGSFSWCGHAWGEDFLECGIELTKFITYWNNKGKNYLNPGDVIGVAAFIETPIDDWGTDFSPGCEITLGASELPVLSVAPSSLDFGTATNSLNFNISNTGSGTLNWTATENESWITSVTPSSGTNTGSVTVTVDRSGLSSGTYTGKVSVASNGGNQDVAISISKSSESLPEHWQFTKTANNATIVLPTSANPNVNGTPLSYGDYIVSDRKV